MEKAFYSRATEQFNNQLLSLMRARNSLNFIVSSEDDRVLKHIRNMSEAFDFKCSSWTISLGFQDVYGSSDIEGLDQGKTPSNLIDALQVIYRICLQETVSTKSKFGNGLIIFLPDFNLFLGKDSNALIQRLLKDIITLDVPIMFIMTGTGYISPESLDPYMTVLDFPLPNDSEIETMLDEVLSGDKIQKKFPSLKEKAKQNRESIKQSLQGLTFQEAKLAVHKSLVSAAYFKVEPLDIDDLLFEKRQMVSKSGVLEFIEPKVTLDDVGGLAPLVDWIKQRKSMLTDEAKDYGLSLPKGVLLLGVPGVGKSLVAKAAASFFGMPLLKLDFGLLFGSLVGKSEERMRLAIKMAEAVSPCILWCDEIEKGIAGSTGSDGDSGTTKRVMSTFLTWLNEKESPVFVFATANNVDGIPPEFMRAGRFDETWFLDIPQGSDRENILEILLKVKGYSSEDFDEDITIKDVANDIAFTGFSGAEIEKAINEAMVRAFLDKKRKITLKDIVNSAKSFKALSITRAEDFVKIRKIAKDCRSANKLT